MTEGRCLCGALRYEISGPFIDMVHCHCSMCRKHHGTPFGTGLGVRRKHFQWLAGEDEVIRYRATAAFERPFCRCCGATVPAESHHADSLHVPAGLLDGEIGARPRTHIFVASKASFDTITDALPQFAAYPPGIDLPVVTTRAAACGQGLSGSCLCGAVGFEADTVPRQVVNCYCSSCRHSRGTAFASAFLATPGQCRWTRGEDRVRTYRLQPHHTFQTAFCTDCGSPVPTAAPDLGRVLLPTGAIDTLLPPLPAIHLHVASKAPWYEITDGWPQFAALPPRDRLAQLL
jgi:hypothetical protein